MYKDPKWFDAQKTHKAIRAGGFGHGLYLPLCKMVFTEYLPKEARSGIWKREDKVKRIWKEVDCQLCLKLNDTKTTHAELLAMVKPPRKKKVSHADA